MKKIIKMLFVCFAFYIFSIDINKVFAEEIIDNVNVYNIDSSSNYVVYEHDFLLNNDKIHYLSLYNLATGEKDILL